VHPILTEDPAYVALTKRRVDVVQRERDFIEKLRADRAAYEKAVGEAAMAGDELPDPPVDPGPSATARFTAEKNALDARITATVADRAEPLTARLYDRERQLLAEVRDRIAPRLDEIAAEIAELGRTAGHIARAVDGPINSCTALTGVQPREEMLRMALLEGSFLDWTEQRYGRTVISGVGGLR